MPKYQSCSAAAVDQFLNLQRERMAHRANPGGKKMKKLSVLIALFILACGLQALGQNNVVYNDPPDQASQDFTGNLALLFQVNSPETVIDLGVYNAAGTGYIPIGTTLDVGLYNITNAPSLVAAATFTGGNTYPLEGLWNLDAYQPIAPVALVPGDIYEVDAVGFNSVYPNGNLATGSSSGPILNNLGGELTFIGAAWDNSPILDSPLGCDGCSAPPAQYSQFDAGTLSVPEGGATLLYLLLAGGACFGAMFLVPRNRFANLASA
jgi:hypothetical protein